MSYISPENPTATRPPIVVNFNDSLGYVLRAIRENLRARGEDALRMEVIGTVSRVSVDFAEIEEHTISTQTDWENQLADAKVADL